MLGAAADITRNIPHSIARVLPVAVAEEEEEDSFLRRRWRRHRWNFLREQGMIKMEIQVRSKLN
jgi:hypothetical protein